MEKTALEALNSCFQVEHTEKMIASGKSLFLNDRIFNCRLDIVTQYG